MPVNFIPLEGCGSPLILKQKFLKSRKTARKPLLVQKLSLTNKMEFWGVSSLKNQHTRCRGPKEKFESYVCPVKTEHRSIHSLENRDVILERTAYLWEKGGKKHLEKIWKNARFVSEIYDPWLVRERIAKNPKIEVFVPKGVRTPHPKAGVLEKGF